MNGKRVEFQKSVKTCSEKLTKRPKKNIRTWNLFGMIFDNLGTIFGNFWGSWRPPKSEFQRESLLFQFVVDFGSLLGPLLGAMLRQNGPPKLSKVTFFELFTLPKSIHFSKTSLRGLWDPLGTLLGPMWGRLQETIRSQNRCQCRHRQKCQVDGG